MTNLARFTIDGTPSSQGGYDVDPGDAPVLALEASSQLVGRVTFEVHSATAGSPRATTGAPTLTLNNGITTGQALDAATPASTVTISAGIPASRAPHLWEVRCKVNGGTNTDGSVNPDYVFSRFIAMRTANGRRKIMPSERGEYDTVEAWASAFNEFVEAYPETNSGLVIPLSSFFLGANWAELVDGSIPCLTQSVTSQDPAQAEITHLLSDGLPITGISITMMGWATRSDVPEDKPGVILLRCSASVVDVNPSLTTIHSAIDSASGLATYITSHEVSVTGTAHTVDLTAYRYFLLLYGEAGNESTTGLLVSRIKLLRS